MCGQRQNDGLSRTDLKETKKINRAHTAEVDATAASAKTKLGSTKLVTYAKARYKAKIVTWTLKQQYEIDKIFYAIHTKTTANMKTFPYDLLYLNKRWGGSGQSRFLDTKNIDKLAELLRAYRRTDEVADAAKRVIERFATVPRAAHADR